MTFRMARIALCACLFHLSVADPRVLEDDKAHPVMDKAERPDYDVNCDDCDGLGEVDFDEDEDLDRDLWHSHYGYIPYRFDRGPRYAVARDLHSGNRDGDDGLERGLWRHYGYGRPHWLTRGIHHAVARDLHAANGDDGASRGLWRYYGYRPYRFYRGHNGPVAARNLASDSVNGGENERELRGYYGGYYGYPYRYYRGSYAAAARNLEVGHDQQDGERALRGYYGRPYGYGYRAQVWR